MASSSSEAFGTSYEGYLLPCRRHAVEHVQRGVDKVNVNVNVNANVD